MRCGATYIFSATSDSRKTLAIYYCQGFSVDSEIGNLILNGILGFRKFNAMTGVRYVLDSCDRVLPFRTEKRSRSQNHYTHLYLIYVTLYLHTTAFKTYLNNN